MRLFDVGSFKRLLWAESKLGSYILQVSQMNRACIDESLTLAMDLRMVLTSDISLWWVVRILRIRLT